MSVLQIKIGALVRDKQLVRVGTGVSNEHTRSLI